AYLKSFYARERIYNLVYLDSIYGQFAKASARRFELGESNLLEKLTAESKEQELSIRLNAARRDYESSLIELRRLLFVEDSLVLADEEPLLSLQQNDEITHPLTLMLEAEIRKADFQVKEARRSFLPDLSLEVFNGSNPGINAQNYPGFQAGVSIPLFFGSNKSKLNAASFFQEEIQLQSQAVTQSLNARSEQLENEISKNRSTLDYYEEEGLSLAEQLETQATRSFQEGEIDFLQLVQLLENSRNIRLQYLQSKLDYQLAKLELIYLTI
ncbi:MAG: TolC family protein, partial [Cyclobacteriaceae bacterium]|nr:TolC family protein [Cyclobacteriaceae bacterium]